jgi:hypothetical protein
MAAIGNTVRVFFEGYEKAGNTLDLDLVDSQYEDTFMFADPNGSRVVEKQKFLAMLPQRQGFFKMLGHQSTKILSLEETKLDDRYLLVEAAFLMQFKKPPAERVEARLDSTFILCIKNDVPRIVFQLEHEDMRRAMQDRGLLPEDQ